jgi:ABC-type multidrug transport system ATPase subunit
VLIGRLRATLGAQYIAGENVINGLSKVHRFIGVCPQFDVVWADLTVAEHLSFQARQRGIPANLVSESADWSFCLSPRSGDCCFLSNYALRTFRRS